MSEARSRPAVLLLGNPNAGKTTLFNVVTGREPDPSEIGRSEARLAVVKVPDGRAERVAQIYDSARATQPEITFADLIALHTGDEHTRRDDSLTKIAGDADAQLSSHEGEELIIVVEGEVELVYGGATQVLKPGDSAYYNSVVQHRVCAANGRPATIYAVVFMPF